MRWHSRPDQFKRSPWSARVLTRCGYSDEPQQKLVMTGAALIDGYVGYEQVREPMHPILRAAPCLLQAVGSVTHQCFRCCMQKMQSQRYTRLRTSALPLCLVSFLCNDTALIQKQPCSQELGAVCEINIFDRICLYGYSNDSPVLGRSSACILTRDWCELPEVSRSPKGDRDREPSLM
jgi:hypothetical protein